MVLGGEGRRVNARSTLLTNGRVVLQNTAGSIARASTVVVIPLTGTVMYSWNTIRVHHGCRNAATIDSLVSSMPTMHRFHTPSSRSNLEAVDERKVALANFD